MRTSRAALVLLQLGLIGALTGCGLGTEVGNGDKPQKSGAGNSNGNGGSNTPAAAAQAGKANGQPANSTASTPTPVPPSSNESNGPGGGASSDTEASGANTPAAAAGALPFDTQLLFTTCASPFGEDLTTPWELSTATGTVLSLAADTKGTYTVSEGSASLYSYTVNAQGPHELQPAPGATATTDAYTCGTVADAANGDSTTYTVTLTKDGVAASVAWTIQDAAASGAKATLAKIVVTPASGAAVTLTGKAPSK